MDLTFTTGSLSTRLPLLKALDEIAIDSSMYLTSDEEKLLLGSGGFAVLCYDENDYLVGGGYAVPAFHIAELVQDEDVDFVPQDNEIYIYSVVVMPSDRKKGIGTLIRSELQAKARKYGFKTGCSHVRCANGWAAAGVKHYKPFETRLIVNFWPDLTDGDVMFMRFNL